MPLDSGYKIENYFEDYLGNPLDSRNTLSFKNIVSCDELERYPEHACDCLNEWGFPLHFIPKQLGGRLSSYEELHLLVRIVSRRDLTCAIALTKTFLGATPVWFQGDSEQQQRVVELIKNNKQVSLALTERSHGSDLLSGELHATKTPDGYCLNGEKWLINNATRGAALSLLARTSFQGGARGFSLFLVDKERICSGQFENLPPVKTHGIRGADISGIRFNNCVIPADALIGQSGSGLEATLKTFQVTRAIVPALSLGAADTALRSTLRFVHSRELYGKKVLDIPYVQMQLAEAFVDLMICECVSVSAIRTLHVLPEQMSIASAVAKYFVPTIVEELLRNLSVILGARHYLRQEHDGGIFQKMLRDHSIVGVFDGSTVVNLDAIAKQLPQLLETYGEIDLRQKNLVEQLESIFNITQDLPAFDPRRLSLTNRGRNDVVQGIQLVRIGLLGHRDHVGLRQDVANTLLKLTDKVLRQLDLFAMRVTQFSSQQKCAAVETELMELARRYCYVYAAASCLQIWWQNRRTLGGHFSNGEWLVLALDRLLCSMEPGIRSLSYPYASRVLEVLAAYFKNDKLFSIYPIKLSQSHQQRSYDMAAG